MKVISGANEGVLKILKNFKKEDANNRFLKYCVMVQLEEGILLFNLLTKELLLLEHKEYKDRLLDKYLCDHWFLVPEDTNEKELVEMVRWVLENQNRKKKNITHYTIFPTTDCNARCFYCFELGRSRIPMTEKTAHKVARYICDHCGGEKVTISWFGGEPLFNQSAIDIISSDLEKNGISFSSRAVSNGYLFDDRTVNKAINKWNLKRVQITLDGTEKIYNKTKAFIYKEGNPYQIVMENIGRLLEAGVTVSIRMNMDLYNAEDLLELVDELGLRFKGHKGIYAYVHHIFDANRPMAEIHTPVEWESRDMAMRRLEERISENGLASDNRISRYFRMNACIADNGSSITILPNGEIGLCEHCSENEFIGHIDHAGFDQVVVESWKERSPEIQDCRECFYYPDCVKLKKCTSLTMCFPQLRDQHRRGMERKILVTYQKWKNGQTAQTEEEDMQC